MEPAFVLVHSLLLGPRTWAPVAARLASSGAATVVPSLVDVTDADDPPFWPRVVDRVHDAVDQLPQGQPVFVVAHSNAGPFVPAIVHAAPRPVAGCLFVEARLPSRTGPTPTASPERLNYLRTQVTEGRLPQWTAWWDEDDVTVLFPDPQTRLTVSAEQPRLPLSYYEQQIPVPDGWDNRPCGFVLFGPSYDHVAQDARERGWDVDQVAGQHLHQLVDPDAVAARIVAMTGRWRLSAG
ncbi:alpha/beta fold hydrolase [Dactylosporangium sp. NPDC048998]|uniref:alpha/beta fold hydrolase n=1 Tax=Dactylosporangium sp. NPDC048998 TaxID=3363976 RepID=UPI0037129B4D